MKKSVMLILVLLTSIVFFASIGGTLATWFLAEDPSESVNKEEKFTLSEFVWAPEEILPTVTPGQNYLDLHHSILENDKGGLNGSKDTLEDAVLSDRDGLVHGEQKVSGGNLKHLFVTQASRELDFIVEYITNSDFRVYMYETADAINGAMGVTRIEVYMTILKKENGLWSAIETQVGTAVIQYFPGMSVPAIDVSTWQRDAVKVV